MNDIHSAGASEQQPNAGSIRVLVVDDDDFDRLSVRRALGMTGLAALVEEASSAEDAKARFTAERFDCVLLDYYMPGTDAMELLRQFRAEAPDVPIIVFTGRGDEDVAVSFMRAGAVDYVPKASLTPDRLGRSCRYALEMSRAQVGRRRAEEELRRREELLRMREAEFRALANSIPQLAWMADSEGRRYWYNDRWYEYTGLRPDQSFGLGWRLAHHPERRTRVCDSQLAAFQRGDVWEDTVQLRDATGGYRWFLSRAVPITSDDGRTIRWFGTNTDVSELLETKRELEISEERFRRALEIETVGVIFFDTEGRITGANDAFLRMGQYTRDDVSAGRVRWDELTPPEFMPESLRAIEELKRNGRTTPYEKQFIRKDGSRWWALFAATRLSEHEGVEFVVDITQQKADALERERLLDSEREARADAERAFRGREEVLSVLAHDLRNPIHSILGAATLIRYLDKAKKREQQIEIVERAARGMNELLTDLLDVSRIEAGTFAVRKAVVDFDTVIGNVVKLFEPQAQARSMTLRSDVRDGVKAVAADAHRIRQVLSNLVGNALKFTEDGGTVTVGAERSELGVQVWVADTGRGISADELPRIFDPFWQANRASLSGAGLGLSICKAIVEAHGGTIWATSVPGQGSTFRFEIPGRTDAPEEKKEAPLFEGAVVPSNVQVGHLGIEPRTY